MGRDLEVRMYVYLDDHGQIRWRAWAFDADGQVVAAGYGMTEAEAAADLVERDELFRALAPEARP